LFYSKELRLYPDIERYLFFRKPKGAVHSNANRNRGSCSMKATIRERVTGARLQDTVPPAYRDEVSKNTNPDGVYTVILLAHNERDVIPSPPLAKAFRRLQSHAADGIIVVGTVFTEEALAIAAEHGARIVALRNSKWTDESARRRQL
jgi:hypothetical protein